MGTEVIVLAVLAASFGMLASLLATKVDNLKADLDEQRVWRAFWEREHHKEKAENDRWQKALQEALEHLGERDDKR